MEGRVSFAIRNVGKEAVTDIRVNVHDYCQDDPVWDGRPRP